MAKWNPLVSDLDSRILHRAAAHTSWAFFLALVLFVINTFDRVKAEEMWQFCKTRYAEASNAPEEE